MAQTTIFEYGEKQNNKPGTRLIRKENQKQFKCCSGPARKEAKKISYNGLEYSYDVWRCSSCSKEYLDESQARKMEKFWLMERLLDEKLISIRRRMNFDGKAFFFRFPKELTQNWNRDLSAEIKMMGPETFLVEINQYKE